MVQKAETDALQLIDFGAAIAPGVPCPNFKDGWPVSYRFAGFHRTMSPCEGELNSLHFRNATLTFLIQDLP